MKKFRLTRDVTVKECPWLDRDIWDGEEVYEFTGHTYGCISHSGVACSSKSNGSEPFFELPVDSLEEIK